MTCKATQQGGGVTQAAPRVLCVRLMLLGACIDTNAKLRATFANPSNASGVNPTNRTTCARASRNKEVKMPPSDPAATLCRAAPLLLHRHYLPCHAMLCRTAPHRALTTAQHATAHHSMALPYLIPWVDHAHECCSNALSGPHSHQRVCGPVAGDVLLCCAVAGDSLAQLWNAQQAGVLVAVLVQCLAGNLCQIQEQIGIDCVKKTDMNRCFMTKG
jgi:hypothetical protein